MVQHVGKSIVAGAGVAGILGYSYSRWKSKKANDNQTPSNVPNVVPTVPQIPQEHTITPQITTSPQITIPVVVPPPVIQQPPPPPVPKPTPQISKPTVVVTKPKEEPKRETPKRQEPKREELKREEPKLQTQSGNNENPFFTENGELKRRIAPWKDRRCMMDSFKNMDVMKSITPKDTTLLYKDVSYEQIH